MMEPKWYQLIYNRTNGKHGGSHFITHIIHIVPNYKTIFWLEWEIILVKTCKSLSLYQSTTTLLQNNGTHIPLDVRCGLGLFWDSSTMDILLNKTTWPWEMSYCLMDFVGYHNNSLDIKGDLACTGMVSQYNVDLIHLVLLMIVITLLMKWWI